MDNYRFTKVGELALVGERVRFNLASPGAERGLVYLWVERTKQQYSVVYVGMAGKTLQARCGQHQNGFVGSVTGRAHAQRLRAGFEAGKLYEVYARRSDPGEVLGETGISMVCVEELAFIKKFRPSWNSGAKQVAQRDRHRQAAWPAQRPVSSSAARAKRLPGGGPLAQR
jgi:hypothetical protein